MAEKASRTPVQKKIESKLLYTLKRQRGDALMQALPGLRTRAQLDSDGTTLVDVRAEVSDTSLEYIARLGGSVVNTVPLYGFIRARLPLVAAETLAAYSDVRSIRTAERYMLNKIDTSEGYVITPCRTSPEQYSGENLRPGEGRIAKIREFGHAKRSDQVPNLAPTNPGPRLTCSFGPGTRMQRPFSVHRASTTR